jgi:Ca2+/Na+ antiporter
MGWLIEVHGALRWLVALALLALIIGTVAVIATRRWQKWIPWAIRSAVLLVTIQFVLGLVLLINDSIAAGWQMHALRLQYEHAVTMLLALGAVHMLPRAARAAEPRVRGRRVLLLALIAALLVAVGVIRLRGAAYWLPF